MILYYNFFFFSGLRHRLLNYACKLIICTKNIFVCLVSLIEKEMIGGQKKLTIEEHIIFKHVILL